MATAGASFAATRSLRCRRPRSVPTVEWRQRPSPFPTGGKWNSPSADAPRARRVSETMFHHRLADTMRCGHSAVWTVSASTALITRREERHELGFTFGQ